MTTILPYALNDLIKKFDLPADIFDNEEDHSPVTGKLQTLKASSIPRSEIIFQRAWNPLHG
jgi:hypothetical protein